VPSSDDGPTPVSARRAYSSWLLRAFACPAPEAAECECGAADSVLPRAGPRRRRGSTRADRCRFRHAVTHVALPIGRTIDRRFVGRLRRVPYRDAQLAWQRAANASCSLWSRTSASTATPAKTVVGSASGLRRRRPGGLRYGVARTDTSDCSASRGRHRYRHRWIRRISWCAEEQATYRQALPTRLLLRVDSGRDTARKASRPERAGSPRRPR
jgi:hypothetical protein